MSRAGAAAVRAIQRHAGLRCDGGVAVFAGPGNNGGDAWVVAGSLRAAGVQVRVHATAQPTTPDARAAQATALAQGAFDEPRGDERVAVDGLLGTGSSGAPRESIARALTVLSDVRTRGAMIFALDLPSGVDATNGDASELSVPADVTITFGTLKRGLTVARALCGAIEVADIGLGGAAMIDDGAPTMLDARAARAAIPPISANAHKGTRGRVAIVGGAEGMAGAAALAARGALRTGAGLVRVVVAPASLAAIQAAVPEATGAVWPTSASGVRDTLGGANAVVIGPGLGAANRALLDMVIGGCDAPVVLDADALNAYAGASSALKAAIITPHPAECARLMGVSTSDVLRDRFDIGLALARACGAVVVLKGTPTVISAPDGRVVVAPVGSPVLATGGSGDVLAGVAGTLLATIHDPMQAALSAVWAHGAAAERVATSRVRGATLADVVDALRDVWHSELPALEDGVLAFLPAVGER